MRRSTRLTATELRANLYRILDAVLATGKPCRVVRGGRTLVIKAETTTRVRRDWSKLRKRPDVLNCTFDELVATTWEYRGGSSV